MVMVVVVMVVVVVVVVVGGGEETSGEAERAPASTSSPDPPSVEPAPLPAHHSSERSFPDSMRRRLPPESASGKLSRSAPCGKGGMLHRRRRSTAGLPVKEFFLVEEPFPHSVAGAAVGRRGWSSALSTPVGREGKRGTISAKKKKS